MTTELSEDECDFPDGLLTVLPVVVSASLALLVRSDVEAGLHQVLLQAPQQRLLVRSRLPGTCREERGMDSGATAVGVWATVRGAAEMHDLVSSGRYFFAGEGGGAEGWGWGILAHGNIVRLQFNIWGSTIPGVRMLLPEPQGPPRSACTGRGAPQMCDLVRGRHPSVGDVGVGWGRAKRKI